MDVIHDSKEKTVIAIIGDVSKYKNGEPTVNFHDYNTGYGVLKNINKQTCILTKSPVPMAPAKKYRMGVTHEVHDHFLKFVPIKLTYEDIEAMAGPKIAAFCKDYTTVLAKVTPLKKAKKDIRSLNPAQDGMKNWCVFSSCIYSPYQLQSITSQLYGN